MAKIFKADKSFVDYITMMGFQFKEVDSEKKYYVNKEGNQFRIDYNKGEIALLDNKGKLVDSFTEISSDEINCFAVYKPK